MTEQHTAEYLRYMQSQPLDFKIAMSQKLIYDAVKRFGEDGLYLSWSGGKDSTVLRHIIRGMGLDIVSVYADTGLEYPEVRQLVKDAKARGENVEIVRPKMGFAEVLATYGYPVISKEVALALYYHRKNSPWAINYFKGLDAAGEANEYKADRYGRYQALTEIADIVFSDKCCGVIKERPLNSAGKSRAVITAIMASESSRRLDAWFKTGCNAFDGKRPQSKPMSFWTEQDVLQYIVRYGVEIPSVYGDVVYADTPEQQRLFDSGEKLKCTGCQRTGCIFCGFGAHIRGDRRFLLLKETHPKHYKFCIGGGEHNADGIWVPNKQGLGMGYVFDRVNEAMGKELIKYK